MTPTYNWTGFYIGGYYGTAIGSQTGSTPTTLAGSHQGQTNVNKYGAMGGLTAGYNWQFAPHWLVGLEGEFGYLGINRSNIEFNDDTTVGLKTDWYGTARARFGYVTGPSLLYATGGAAFVHYRDEFGGDAPNNTVASTSSSKTTASWTAGYGAETKLTRAWSAKTEYLFIDGGDNNDFIANPRGVSGVPSTFSHGYHLVKTGLNYKFGKSESFFAFMNAPMMPSDHDWRGFYVGVNVGGGQSLVHTTQTTPTFPLGTTDINGTGFAGGGQVGYNFTGVLMPKFFAGVEGDFGALHVHARMKDWFDQEARFHREYQLVCHDARPLRHQYRPGTHLLHRGWCMGASDGRVLAKPRRAGCRHDNQDCGRLDDRRRYRSRARRALVGARGVAVHGCWP